jgi:predicted transcriptional regulator
MTTTNTESKTIGVSKKRWVVCFENTILELDLSTYEKLVYIVLCSHARKDGLCYPSVKKIAAEASCSRAKVFEALKILEERGIITRRTQVFEGRGQTSNLYEIIDITPRPQNGQANHEPTFPPSILQTGESTYQTGESTVATGGSTIATGRVHVLDTHIKVLEQDHINKTKEQEYPPTPQGIWEGRNEKYETSKPQNQNQKHDTEAKSEEQIQRMEPDAAPLHETILRAFNEILPELPGAERLTASRIKALRLRIGEDPARKEADWWKQYFDGVRLFPWLMGNNPHNWKATFDWLIGETGMQKVIEGGFMKASRPEYSREELLEWQRRYTDERGIVDAKALLRDWRAHMAGMTGKA